MTILLCEWATAVAQCHGCARQAIDCLRIGLPCGRYAVGAAERLAALGVPVPGGRAGEVAAAVFAVSEALARLEHAVDVLGPAEVEAQRVLAEFE